MNKTKDLRIYRITSLSNNQKIDSANVVSIKEAKKIFKAYCKMVKDYMETDKKSTDNTYVYSVFLESASLKDYRSVQNPDTIPWRTLKNGYFYLGYN